MKTDPKMAWVELEMLARKPWKNEIAEARADANLILLAILLFVVAVTAFMDWALQAASPAEVAKPPAQLADQAGDLSGIYSCEGKDYSGVVVITRLREVYLVQWAVGGSSTLGAGVRQGDYLSAGWVDAKQTRGTTLFKIDGKTLKGRWASIPGDGRLHTETLTFIQALPPMPEPLPKE